MTMDCMVRYLESCGFKADKKYDPDTKSYRFTIESDGRYLVRHFKWLNCDAPWLHQKQFLDSMVNEFEKESKSDSLMTSLFGKPSSKWTDPKTGKEFGYSWGFDKITGDFSDYVKNDIQSTSYVSDIINKIIHEKEQEEMSNCIDRVKWRMRMYTDDIEKRIEFRKNELNSIANTNKFGMQVPLNPLKIDFDLGTVTQKILVDSVENLEDAMVSEICKIAREKGVTTLILLEKQKIAEALGKATAKPVKRTNKLIKSSTPNIPDRYQESIACPSCLVPTSMVYKYCGQCGQKLDWEEKDE